jgi:hypothetical protein
MFPGMFLARSRLSPAIHWCRAHCSRQLMSRALLPIAVTLWAVSMLQAEFHLGPLGLVHCLPPTFFVAMFILSISFLLAIASPGTPSRLLGLHLAALVGAVGLVPIVLEQTARFPYVYDSYAYADYIVRTGHFSLAHPYHNWPGLHLLNAALIEISGLDPGALMLWSPIALQVGVLGAQALLFSKLCETRQELWMALWLSVAFRGSGYLLPSTVAGLPMLVVLFIAVTAITRSADSEGTDLGYTVLRLVLMGTVVTSHLLHSWLLVLDLGLLWLVATLMRKKNSIHFTTILAGVLVLIWMLYVTVGYTEGIIRSLLAEILNLDAVVSSTQLEAYGGSPAHSLVFSVRLLYVLALSVLGLSGFVEGLLHRRPIAGWLIPGTWVVGAASFALVTSYGGEILARAYYAALFALVVLASRHVRGRGFAVMAAVIVVSSLLYPINAWGNEAVDYVPPSEIDAVMFLREKHPTSYSIVANPVRVWRWVDIDRVNRWAGDPLIVVGSQAASRSLAFLDTTTEDSVTGADPWLGWSRVHDNGEVQLQIAGYSFRWHDSGGQY